MTSRQLNLRLTAEEHDRLEALAFLRRTTATAVARAAVETYLEAHAAEPGLTAALDALREHDAAGATGRTRAVTRLRRAQRSAAAAEGHPAR